jgi:hypothetical protein
MCIWVAVSDKLLMLAAACGVLQQSPHRGLGSLLGRELVYHWVLLLMLRR